MFKKYFLVLFLFIIGCTSDNSSFKNQELSGKLDSKPWKANHVEGETFDFGTHKKNRSYPQYKGCGCAIPPQMVLRS